MSDPRAVVGWIAIEEKAEGGDALYLEAKRHPHFSTGLREWLKGVEWRFIDRVRGALTRLPATR